MILCLISERETKGDGQTTREEPELGLLKKIPFEKYTPKEVFKWLSISKEVLLGTFSTTCPHPGR